MQDFRPPDNVETSGTAPSGHTPDRWVNEDLVELRLIGTWLNESEPIDYDSDGDRVLAAADELERLRAATSTPRVVTPPACSCGHQQIDHVVTATGDDECWKCPCLHYTAVSR